MAGVRAPHRGGRERRLRRHRSARPARTVRPPRGGGTARREGGERPPADRHPRRARTPADGDLGRRRPRSGRAPPRPWRHDDRPHPCPAPLRLARAAATLPGSRFGARRPRGPRGARPAPRPRPGGHRPHHVARRRRGRARAGRASHVDQARPMVTRAVGIRRSPSDHGDPRRDRRRQVHRGLGAGPAPVGCGAGDRVHRRRAARLPCPGIRPRRPCSRVRRGDSRLRARGSGRPHRRDPRRRPGRGGTRRGGRRTASSSTPPTTRSPPGSPCARWRAPGACRATPSSARRRNGSGRSRTTPGGKRRASGGRAPTTPRSTPRARRRRRLSTGSSGSSGRRTDPDHREQAFQEGVVALTHRRPGGPPPGQRIA